MQTAANANASTSAGEQSARREAEPAPKLRRIAAWFADLAVAMALSTVCLGVVGYFAPPETAKVLMLVMLPGFVLAIAYVGCAPPVFGNSVGKWLFGLRIVADQGERVGALGWTLRLLVGAIWPVNGIVMLSSPTGRHLGDLAAKTRVVFAQPQRSFWLGLIGTIALFVAAFQVSSLSMKTAMINSAASRTARTFLAAEHPNARVAKLPAGFQIINDEALFDFRVDDEYDRVILERAPGSAWRVARSGRIDEPSTAIGISFGASTSD